MPKMTWLWHGFAAVAIALLSWWWVKTVATATDGQSTYPVRPVQVVVPYAAGGGSDTFVRILQQGIDEDGILGQPLVIINQPGGIGTIGSREVKNADPDGYKILCHHNAIITAKLAGTVPYGPEAFEPVAMTGEMSMVILVRADSPFRNLRDLLNAAQQSPREVRFGANKGAPAFFTVLQLEKTQPGAEFSIVSSGGGADRYTKIIGGHLEAGIFSLSEYLDFRGVEGTPASEDIRAIALLSEDRHEAIPDVPTTVEIGIPVVLSNANYWWVPIGTPAGVTEKLTKVFESAMQNEAVRKELSRLRMEPTFESGEPLQKRLGQTVASFESVAADKSTSLPPFPTYVAVLVAVLLGWTVFDAARNGAPSPAPLAQTGRPFQRRPQLAVACFVVLMAYVYALQAGWVPFAVATAIMVFVAGGLMLRYSSGRWLIVIELALLAGMGSQFIFQELFETVLP